MENLESLHALWNELIEQQKKKLLEAGRKIVPSATFDDILQPQDFPEWENHAPFRYEEGILDGLQVAKAAYLAWVKDRQRKV